MKRALKRYQAMMEIARADVRAKLRAHGRNPKDFQINKIAASYIERFADFIRERARP